MRPEDVRAMRLEMEKQALSLATAQRLVRRGTRAAAPIVQRATKAVKPSLARAGKAVRAGAREAGLQVKEFGQRQLHGFTGSHSGALTSGLKRKQQRIVRDMADLEGDALAKAVGKWKDTAVEIGEREAAHKAGITSIPSLAKNLAKKPKETIKALGRQATGGSKRGLALTLGLPGAAAAWDLRKGDESGQGGATVGQKVVRHGTSLGAGVLTGGLSFLPGMVASSAIEGGVNRGFDRATRGSRKQLQQIAPARPLPAGARAA